MTETKKRQTAYQVWISELIINPYIKQEGKWESNYVEIKDKQVSRVNLIATVISKFKSEDGSYVSLVIDDGTAGIRVKVWREDTPILEKVEPGNMVNVIGKIREFNDERYVLPEVVKILTNPNWELLRKLELLKLGKPLVVKEEKKEIKLLKETITKESEPQEEVKEKIFEEEFFEETEEESPRQKILSILIKLDQPGGIETETVIQESKVEESLAENILEDLVKEGQVFQPLPGKVKII